MILIIILMVQLLLKEQSFVKSDNKTVDISYGVIKRQITEFISPIKALIVRHLLIAMCIDGYLIQVICHY